MNKGTFFVHKSNTNSVVKTKHDSIVRASTYLQNSMLFNKFKKRDSQNSKVKTSVVIDKPEEGFRNKRKSKTFIENSMLKNKLATAQKSKREQAIVHEMSNNNINENLLLSMKTIDANFTNEISKRPSTKAKTNERSNDINEGEPTDSNFEEDEISDKLNRTLSNFSPESK